MPDTEVEVEWVNRPTKDGQAGYWRRVPRTRRDPSLAQAEARLRFSEFSNLNFGIRGKVETEDGRKIPIHAAILGDETRGIKYKKEEKLTPWERFLLIILKERYSK